MKFLIPPAVFAKDPSFRVGILWVRSCVNLPTGPNLVEPSINPLSDICTVVSKRHGILVRGVDFDRCEGTVRISPVLLEDEDGVVGEKAVCSQHTLHAVLLVKSLSPTDALEPVLEDLLSLISDYVGGTIERYVLSSTEKTVELVSNRSWDDDE